MTLTELRVPEQTTARKLVGQPLDRVDGGVKTTGRARYSAEYPFAELAHAAVVYSTIARGRITAIDTRSAEALPGVIAVITHLNAPKLRHTRAWNTRNPLGSSDGTGVDFLNTDRIHWNGQPLALVVADTLDIARDAVDRIRVSYTEEPAVVDFLAEQLHAVEQPNALLFEPSAHKGHADSALASAAVQVDNIFTTAPQTHNAMELHATTAVWDGDRLTVYEGTQWIDGVQGMLARKFNISARNVRIVSKFVGGGFGSRFLVWPGTMLAVLAARVVQRPVRLMLTREGVFRTVGGRTPTIQRLALGATPDGRLSSLIHTSVTELGHLGGHPEQVTWISQHLYPTPNLQAQQSQVKLDWLPNSAMRAPGEAVGSFALESSIDELAERLGIDPIDLRMRNEPDRDPVSGKRFSHRRLRETYALGAKVFGWSDRVAAPRSMRRGTMLVGYGVATAYHPAMTLLANVTVKLDADGHALVRCGFHEMGMGGATAYAQIVADQLSLPFDAITVEYGDSELPTAPLAGGSVQSASMSASLIAVCADLRRQRQRHPHQPQYEARVGSDTGLGRAANIAKFIASAIPDQRRWTKAAAGAQFCEVHVDADTGEMRVARWVGVFDIGTVLNAKTAASQLRGGIVMGIGLALSEETQVDPRSGRIVNANLAEYHVPTHADVPSIEIHCLDDPDPTMPLGVLGTGEVGIVGVAAAIANAVYHATGVRVRQLPITLDTVLPSYHALPV